jgi:DNA polymerase-3 subunit epsilon
MSEKYAIVDIETTGGSRRSHKITEIAIIITDGETILDQYQTLINPERSIPQAISYLTGITNEMVREAPKFYQVAKDIIHYLKDCIFVAHNVYFDFNFIKAEFNELGYDFKTKKLCTVRMARTALPGHESYSLGKIAKELGIKISARHRAMGDCEATFKLFKMIKKAAPEILLNYAQKKEANLSFPTDLQMEDYEKLPHRAGVYYFYNAKNELLYIGKSVDIKKRVQSHFRLNIKRKKDMDLKNQIHRIAYTETGSELAALLLECDEIKKSYPPYNRSLKRVVFPYVVIAEKKDSYYELKVKSRGNFESIAEFKSKKAAVHSIEKYFQKALGIKTEFFDLKMIENYKKILGNQYNDVVLKYFEQFAFEKGDFELVLSGRTRQEEAILSVKDSFPRKLSFFDDEGVNQEFNFTADRDHRMILMNYLSNNSRRHELKKLEFVYEK